MENRLVLPDELIRLADTGVVVIVGTCDRVLVPELSRAWGVRVLPDRAGLEVCVSAQVCGRTLANLADNQQIAVTITNPRTYRSFQVKGQAVDTRATDSADLERIAAHQRAFVEAVVSVGLTEASALQMLAPELAPKPAFTAIRVAVQAVFDQTPGPGAGSRL
jgi:hypothetical protein